MSHFADLHIQAANHEPPRRRWRIKDMRGNVIAAIPDRNDALLNWFDITKRTCVRERTHRTYALNLMDSAAVPTPGVDTLMVHFRPNKPAIIYTRAS